MVTIRLARHGAKKRPFYHLTVADSRASREGRVIERVGYFNPLSRGKEQALCLNQERIDYWIGVGAQPTPRVKRLMKTARKNSSAD